MHKILTWTVAASVLLASGSALAAKKMVCWTDEKGQKACGDRVPPQYAKGEREVLDSQGRVIDIKARQKTPSEIAEEERAAKAAAEEKARQEEQARYDRFLLETYNSMGQLQRARDDSLLTLDNRTELAEKGVKDTEASLATLKERAAKPSKNEKETKKLNRQVKDFEAALVAGLKSVSSLKRDREATCSKFKADMRRFHELRKSAATAGATFECPTPQELAPPVAELPKAEPSAERPDKQAGQGPEVPPKK
ncbi:MAG TPA: hypothetical protein VM074_03505 [Solimonas sp.]|nr:hypothetical protein [Solimonas sp.]